MQIVLSKHCLIPGLALQLLSNVLQSNHRLPWHVELSPWAPGDYCSYVIAVALNDDFSIIINPSYIDNDKMLVTVGDHIYILECKYCKCCFVLHSLNDMKGLQEHVIFMNV